MKVYILFSVGHVKGVVNNYSLAKRWEKANPYFTSKSVIVDGLNNQIENIIKSETARLKKLSRGKKFTTKRVC